MASVSPGWASWVWPGQAYSPGHISQHRVSLFKARALGAAVPSNVVHLIIFQSVSLVKFIIFVEINICQNITLGWHLKTHTSSAIIAPHLLLL